MKFIFGFILCYYIIFVVFSLGSFVASEKAQIIYTEYSGAYVDWFDVHDSNIFKFKIRGTAFTLNLAPLPENGHPKIEIGLCHQFAPTSGVIWQVDTEVVNIKLDSKYLLSEDRYIGYWVTWFNNHIKIGLEGEAKEFMSFKDTNPFPIEYIGIHTTGNSAIFIIENN